MRNNVTLLDFCHLEQSDFFELTLILYYYSHQTAQTARKLTDYTATHQHGK